MDDNSGYQNRPKTDLKRNDMQNRKHYRTQRKNGIGHSGSLRMWINHDKNGAGDIDNAEHEEQLIMDRAQSD